MLLDFGDRTRTGIFNVVWPLPKEEAKIGLYGDMKMRKINFLALFNKST